MDHFRIEMDHEGLEWRKMDKNGKWIKMSHKGSNWIKKDRSLLNFEKLESEPISSRLGLKVFQSCFFLINLFS